jgi:serine/threonine protein phosphatase PrpC
MEDAVLFHSFNEQAFVCGVFDGHTGPMCAVTAADLFPHILAGVLDSDDLSSAFGASFAELNAKLKERGVPDGCTAAVVLVVMGISFIAGVGDSRVVRVTRNGFQRSTMDSKPFDRREFRRLRARELTPTADGRVDRKLAVARSLGDFYVRGEGLFEPPEIYGFQIAEDDVGLIIACDGLWDVMGDEPAAEIARAAETAADAAVALRNYALALGTKDNVSVIVLKWKTQEVGLCPRNTVEPLPVLPDEEEPESDGPPASPAPLPARRRR